MTQTTTITTQSVDKEYDPLGMSPRFFRVLFCSSRRRRWLGVLGILMLLFVSLFLSGYQSRVMSFIFAKTLTTRYTSKELEAMIPLEDDGKELFVHSRRSQSDDESKQSNVTSADNQHLDILPDEITCKVVDPKVLFFVRIPKCASTSFVEQLKVWSKLGLFELFFHPSGAYDWDIRTIKKVAGQVNAKKGGRFVYARHFYYTDFRMYGVEDYSYITILREPVARFLSSFLYYHYSSKSHIQAILDPSHKNETLLECIEHQHEGCAHNWLTKYFCGHEKFCKLGNEQALKTAKQNLLRDFTAVGLLEEMDLSMALFRTLLPGYFKVDHEDKLPMTNRNEQHLRLSAKEEEAIRSANQADLKLYDFVRTLFHKTTEACHLG